MDGYLINFRIGFRKLSLQSWITYWTEKLKHNYRMTNHLKPDFLKLSFLVSSPTWSQGTTCDGVFKTHPKILQFLSFQMFQAPYMIKAAFVLYVHVLWLCIDVACPSCIDRFNRRILEVCWFTQLNLSFWTTPSQKGIAQISVPQSLVSDHRAGISAWLHGLFFFCLNMIRGEDLRLK